MQEASPALIYVLTLEWRKSKYEHKVYNIWYYEKYVCTFYVLSPHRSSELQQPLTNKQVNIASGYSVCDSVDLEQIKLRFSLKLYFNYVAILIKPQELEFVVVRYTLLLLLFWNIGFLLEETTKYAESI